MVPSSSTAANCKRVSSFCPTFLAVVAAATGTGIGCAGAGGGFTATATATCGGFSSSSVSFRTRKSIGIWKWERRSLGAALRGRCAAPDGNAALPAPSPELKELKQLLFGVKGSRVTVL